MKYLLRSSDTGLFYKDPEKWTHSTEDALSFESVQKLHEFATVMNIADAEVYYEAAGSRVSFSLSVPKKSPSA